MRYLFRDNAGDQANAAACSGRPAATSAAAWTKRATAREREASGQAATTSLGLRSLTGTKTSSAQLCHRATGSALYSGVKAFIDQVTRVAAAEFAARKITVNAVAPGTTTTGRLAQLPIERREQVAAAFTLGRIGEPADTAAVVAFLASAEAGFITGQVIYNTRRPAPAGRPTWLTGPLLTPTLRPGWPPR